MTWIHFNTEGMAGHLTSWSRVIWKILFHLSGSGMADKAGHRAAHRDLPPTSKLHLLKVPQACQIVQSAGEHSFMSLWGAFHSQYITIWILLLYIHDEANYMPAYNFSDCMWPFLKCSCQLVLVVKPLAITSA